MTALLLYLLVGYLLYRARWPDGLLPVEADPDRERVRRLGRRRVLPLPGDGGDP